MEGWVGAMCPIRICSSLCRATKSISLLSKKKKKTFIFINLAMLNDLFVSRLVQTMDYSVIVFDTAPTGHTLRLLQFPSTLEKGLSKLMSLKSRFGGIMGQVLFLIWSLDCAILIWFGDSHVTFVLQLIWLCAISVNVLTLWFLLELDKVTSLKLPRTFFFFSWHL